MAAKSPILERSLACLEERYANALPEGMSVLDHLLFGVLQENQPVSKAIETYRRLRQRFVDLNELRVSHRQEVEDLLLDWPERGPRSRRILTILQFVFETTYSFDLEGMRKKPLKQAQRQISKIAGATPYAICAAIQRGLGGHVATVDEAGYATLKQLPGQLGEDLDGARSAIEAGLTKAKAKGFCILLTEWAGDPEGEATTAAILAQLPEEGSPASSSTSSTPPPASKPKSAVEQETVSLAAAKDSDDTTADPKVTKKSTRSGRA